MIPAIDATQKSGFLLIGHSQGGIIGRNAGFQRSDLINGVVTISSPHTGAKVARNGRAVAPTVAAMIGGLPAAALVLNIADRLIPVHLDLIPGSGLLDRVNREQYETFTRVGIQNYAKKRWNLWRLSADADCAGPELDCGGRAKVRYIQRYYDHRVQCTGIGILTFWTGIGAAAAAYCGTIVVAMNTVDIGWNLFTASPGEPSDAFIDGTSQVYPHTPGDKLPVNYTIRDADSHAGEVRSPLVHPVLVQTMRQDFGVAERPR